NAERFVRTAGESRARCGSGRWKRVAVYVREADAGALEEPAVFEHACHAAAALRALPCVGPEGIAVKRGKTRDDRLLETGEKLADAAAIHVAALLLARPGRRDFCSACFQRAMPDVTPVLHAVEAYAIDDV